MKKILLACILFAASTPLFSQLDKGQWLIGGNLTFARTSEKEGNDFYKSTNKETQFQLTPGAGYFFQDRMAAGLRIGYSSDVSNYTMNGAGPFLQNYKSKTTETGFVLSPFFRYYFLPAQRKVNLLAEVAYLYSNVKVVASATQSYIDPISQLPVFQTSKSTNKATSNGFSVAAGPAFILNPHLSIETTLGYNYNSISKNGGNSDRIFAGVGIQAHLGKRK